MNKRDKEYQLRIIGSDLQAAKLYLRNAEEWERDTEILHDKAKVNTQTYRLMVKTLTDCGTRLANTRISSKPKRAKGKR